MKLAVIGSRSFNDMELLNDTLSKYDIELLISGGAKGADALAEHYALKNNIPVLIFKPDWDIGKHAGFIRNTTIIESCDHVVAFWDGKSKGTMDSIKKAKMLGKQCDIITFPVFEVHIVTKVVLSKEI